MAFQKQLPAKSADLSAWYTAIVTQAGLADYGPAKGTMIIRPYGYALWEATQQYLDKEIKKHGVENCYFPMFIPESLLRKEKEHVEGFSPELAVVTVGGGEQLQEPLVVRPTSETIMYDAFSRWISSWRDLPLKINQWCNVVRWEKRTYLFLRTSEFLWQEGHTAHATHEEALETVKWAIDAYVRTYRDLYALPGYMGRKSETEKFAGAERTYTYEMMMPGGKALQASTSHDLGQHFSKPFEIQFQDKDGNRQYAWQTSWGFSTRGLGALILVHGDDKGLRLPPKMAPVQIVILPVRVEPEIVAAAEKLAAELSGAGYRVKIDADEGQSLGWRINEWETRGVPLRIELGKRELEQGSCTVVRRDTGEKSAVGLADATAKAGELLQSVHDTLLAQATELLEKSTRQVGAWDEFKKIMEGERGFLKSFWCGDRDCEAQIKEETKATTRCLAEEGVSGQCVHCNKPASERWYFAQSY